MAGGLVLVATPIGNLGDMSPRAVEALKAADVIACEDSRHTRKLLTHFDIHGVRVMSLHQHNERERADELVDRIQAGETIALVSDAGMPAISDPGEVIVEAVAGAGLPVSVVPGPSAVPAALAVSGLSTERFCFEGFLPRKGRQRKERLDEIARESRTTIIYESPHRVLATAQDLATVSGPGRRVALVRELTKIHEEVWRGDLGGLVERLQGETKGECVLVLEGAPTRIDETDDDAIVAAVKTEMVSGTSKRDAVASVAAQLDVPRNRVYDLVLSHNL